MDNLSSIVEVEGIEEACQWLDQVGSIVAARGYVNGFDAAAEVLEQALWPRVPVDLKALINKAHGGHGALVANLTRDIQIDAQGRGGMLEIGFGNLGHIAMWVEYGHQIVRGGRLMNYGKKGKGRVIGEPVKPHPFMRPAFDAGKEPAIDAFVEGVKRALKGTPGYSEAA